jgi:hypothetical protein
LKICVISTCETAPVDFASCRFPDECADADAFRSGNQINVSTATESGDTLSSTELLVHDVCPYRVLKKIGAATISWLDPHKALEEPGAKK